jgi:hypothetical protein
VEEAFYNEEMNDSVEEAPVPQIEQQASVPEVEEE